MSLSDADIMDIRRDAERIDWLERQFKSSTVYMDGTQPFSPYNSHKLRDLRGTTFRAAIDAAMGEKK